MVSNIFYFPFNIWDNPSHWLIFFKRVKATNQIHYNFHSSTSWPQWWALSRAGGRLAGGHRARVPWTSNDGAAIDRAVTGPLVRHFMVFFKQRPNRGFNQQSMEIWVDITNQWWLVDDLFGDSTTRNFHWGLWESIFAGTSDAHAQWGVQQRLVSRYAIMRRMRMLTEFALTWSKMPGLSLEPFAMWPRLAKVWWAHTLQGPKSEGQAEDSDGGGACKRNSSLFHQVHQAFSSGVVIQVIQIGENDLTNLEL